MHKKNDEVLDKLRKIQPNPADAEKLTNSIIGNIKALPAKKKRYITVNVSDKQWSVINGFRVLLSSAAVFLIGYMIFQQWETNQQLEVLQKTLLDRPNNLNYAQTTNMKIFKAINELKINATNLSDNKNQSEEIQINQKSLNLLVQEIQKMKKENQSYRDKFLVNN
jgi:methylthioribose-1-phosphate isomerase